MYIPRGVDSSFLIIEGREIHARYIHPWSFRSAMLALSLYF